jgi:excisionase family DNA binding protein
MSAPVTSKGSKRATLSQPLNCAEDSIPLSQLDAPREPRDPEGAEIEPAWLTYRDAEIYSSLSRTTLWKLITQNELEAARVGRAVRLSRASLDAYMKRSAAGPTIVETR